jgi:UDPglucose--hexose-1-phosphate uridylyltransferase
MSTPSTPDASATNPLMATTPHRRFNPLKREWVLVSPQRTQRPWQGQMEKTAQPVAQPYDPECYLCPGNPRAGGHVNPQYTSTFVFENDYAALKPQVEPFASDVEAEGLLVAASESGVCRVLCFSPRHDLTLAQMEPTDIRKVVDLWAVQIAELGARPEIAYVQIFENRGAMMGASNPHPHGQIWASQSLPDEIVSELAAQQAYLAEHGKPLLVAYAELEEKLQERVVFATESFLAVVPYWAVWPFETMILPRRHVTRMEGLTSPERDDLAGLLQRLTATYNNVFDTPFPYSMGFHPAPTDGAAHPEWQMHAHFYPPLLRSATIRKFMVGYELLGSPQRDITPESAAQTLRDAAAR